MRPPRLLVQLLLTFTLLFAQQAVSVHAVWHLAAQASKQDSLPEHPKVCDKCILSAQLNDVLLGQAALLETDSPQPALTRTGGSVHIPAPTRPFSSRAPPSPL
jgi:hypothetical protein